MGPVRWTVLIALLVMVVASPAFAAQPKLRSCDPVVSKITYNGKRINFFGPLSATKNVPCSTARAMSQYVANHEIDGGFWFHGGFWSPSVSRPKGFSGPTVFTLSTAMQRRVIKVKIAVPVS